MALIVWNRSYSVGIDAFDADHIIITSLINHLDDAKIDGCEETAIAMILRTLISFSVGHFRREEAFLEKRSYPDLARHIEQHHLVEQQLKELYAEYQRTADPEISKEIMELLNFWIVEHILKVDMKYKNYVS